MRVLTPPDESTWSTAKVEQVDEFPTDATGRHERWSALVGYSWAVLQQAPLGLGR